MSLTELEMYLSIIARKEPALILRFVAFCLRRGRAEIRRQRAINPTATIPGHYGLFNNWIEPYVTDNNAGVSSFESAIFFAKHARYELGELDIASAVDDAVVVSKQVAETFWHYSVVADGFRLAGKVRADESIAHLRYAYILQTGGE